MPRLTPATQAARREHIVEAAERCFARAGFHRTTMHDICQEAGVSAGALYVYFPSKEALIAGISERDRAEFAKRLELLAAAPDFLAALSMLGEQYFVDEPAHKRLMCIEIGVESTRNPQVGEIYRSVDTFVLASFEKLFQRLKDEGRIAPSLDIPILARVFITISDGLFWRRAIDPAFDGKAVLPAITALIGAMLNPTTPSSANTKPQSAAEAAS
jgi:AcrR family transcriptional regulator